MCGYKVVDFNSLIKVTKDKIADLIHHLGLDIEVIGETTAENVKTLY